MKESTIGTQPAILIVEDDKGLSHLVRRTLEREGLDADYALTGSDAIARIHSNSNVLLLLDYSLPDMSGSELISQLKQESSEVPFIVITGQGNEEVAVEMMKLGAKEYLIKDSNLLDMVPIIVNKVLKEIENERRLAEAEMIIQEKSYLNQIILDRMPFLTLLIQPYTREILAANAAAIQLGATPGKKCYESWGKRDAPCPWCKAPILWENGTEQHCTFEAGGTIWYAYWVPVDNTMYMHYAFDVSMCSPCGRSDS